MRVSLAIMTVLLLLPTVNALAVSPAFIEIDFAPEAVQNITIKVSNNANTPAEIRAIFEGELKDVLTLSDPLDEVVEISAVSSRNINVIIRLPKSLEKAGKRTAAVTFTETRGAGGAVAVLTGISVPISINVPYPGKYAEMQMQSVEVEENKIPVFEITAKNLGKEHINRMIGRISVFSNDVLLETIASLPTSIKPQSSVQLRLKSVRKYKAGEYKLTAYADYDGLKTASETASLRVGTLYINITGYTNELEQDSVNRVALKIKNLWNKAVSNIAAEIKLMTLAKEVKDEVKTSSTDLKPWEEGQITTFLNTANLTAGPYELEVTLTYEGEERTETLPVMIRERPLPIEEAPVKQIKTLRIILIVIIIIVVVDVILIIFLRRKQHKDLASFKQELDKEL